MKKIFFLILGIIISLAILGINLFLIFPWFSGSGPVNLGSIEVSYVSMGRFIVDYFPHLSFAPYWYFGFPFHLFYTPLLPILEAILAKYGIGLWQAYRILTGAGFALAPVSLFLFVWYLTKKIIPGILAAFGYTFLPTLFYFVLSSGEVAQDVISSDFLDPRRLVILARWGEGPHIASLAFLPLAGLFYLRVLESKKVLDLIFAALFIGLTALTNAVGFYGLIILLLAIFFSGLVERGQDTQEVLRKSLVAAGLSYGMIAFWYNLSFISSFFGEGGGVLKNYIFLFPWGYIFLFLAIVVLFYFFKKVNNRAITISFIWFLLSFLIVYIYYSSAPPAFSEQRLELAPQALRLMTEVDMALAVLLASMVGVVMSFLEKRGKKIGWLIGNLIGLTLISGLLTYGYLYFPYGQKAVSEEVDLRETGEYEIAQWLDKNVDQKKGERVYLAGNYGFYLNYFTDVWQLRGGLYQAQTHPWPEHIFYQINHGEDKEIALPWLKAANIRYLVVNTAGSREIYQDFKNPEKFKDLEVSYQNQGDIIYEVPLKDTSPVKVIDLGRISDLVPPKKADDKRPLFAYTNWLEESSPALFEVVNNDLYKIKARLNQGEGILVQMTYDKGFKAKSGQGDLKIIKDPLGFMVLVPPKPGEYEIDFSHGHTWKIWLGYLTTLLTVLIVALSPLWRRKPAQK